MGTFFVGKDQKIGSFGFMISNKKCSPVEIKSISLSIAVGSVVLR